MGATGPTMRSTFSNAAEKDNRNIALGGVVGGVSALSGNDFAVVIKSSTNYGKVSRTSASKKEDAMGWGGIGGGLKGKES